MLLHISQVLHTHSFLPKVWQWIRHRAALEEGGFVTTNTVRKMVAEVVSELGAEKEVRDLSFFVNCRQGEISKLLKCHHALLGPKSRHSFDGGGHVALLS